MGGLYYYTLRIEKVEYNRILTISPQQIFENIYSKCVVLPGTPAAPVYTNEQITDYLNIIGTQNKPYQGSSTNTELIFTPNAGTKLFNLQLEDYNSSGL